ncbi:UNVERIFIED_CONTAM: hypothetical protein FKN15_025710 [Acipenser sinensis]
MLCESEGWFHKPELHWRNVKDADLTGRAVLTEKQGTDGLFTLQSALQLSQQEADGIICLIRQGEKRILQTRVYISGQQPARPYPTIVSVSLPLQGTVPSVSHSLKGLWCHEEDWEVKSVLKVATARRSVLTVSHSKSTATQ